MKYRYDSSPYLSTGHLEPCDDCDRRAINPTQTIASPSSISKQIYQAVTITACSGHEVFCQNDASLTMIWNCSCVEVKSWGRELLSSALGEAQLRRL